MELRAVWDDRQRSRNIASSAAGHRAAVRGQCVSGRPREPPGPARAGHRHASDTRVERRSSVPGPSRRTAKLEVVSSEGQRHPCRKEDEISWTMTPECEPSDQASHTCE